jgi:hypothetical protein
MNVRRSILFFLIAITMLAFFLQVIILPSAVNIAAAAIVMSSSLALLLYLLWSKALDTHPLSTFSILGFCFTSQLGALLAQTAAWTAISASLYDPLYTFGMLAFYQAVALGVHCAYRFFSVKRAGHAGLIRGLLGWAGVYAVPRPAALWVIGLVGLCTFPVAHLESAVGKVATGFIFLTWAPFLIIFYTREQGESYCNVRLHRALLLIYLMMAVLLGLALNTRAVMFQGVATIGLLYLFAGMRSDAPVTRRALLRLAGVALVLAVVAVPASEVATAMAVARQWRGKVSATEMIRTTFFVLSKPNIMAAYKRGGETASRYGAYDEHYVENPLMNRLVTTKYADNAFHFARTLTTDEAKDRLQDISIKFAWMGLPTPIYRRFGVTIAKEDLAYSMGDYLAYLSRGVPLGGHRIGSMFAQGNALMGPLFPFAYGIIVLCIFFLLDLWTVRQSAATSLATLGMLQIWNVFNSSISYEAVHTALYFIFRNWEQMVLIYVLVFGFVRLIVRDRRPSTAALDAPEWLRA